MNSLIKASALFLIVAALGFPFTSFSQEDSTKKNSFNEYLLTRKGIFGRLAKVLMTDTSENVDPTNVQRNDVRFQRYRGKVIRNILIRRLNFGIPLSDTTKQLNSSLVKLANAVHHKTIEQVVSNNLFFRSRDSVQPFLLADNERYLRDLPYLQDAKISVVRLFNYPDSVDILVRTKDVLSLGLEVSSVDLNNTAIAFTEENLGGLGDKVTLKSLFDQSRAKKFGYGFEYVRRNISGSFIDAYVGYQNFNLAINGKKEENTYYVKLIRPLANTYMRWTYSFEASRHETTNMYASDSVYNSDQKYSYNNFDLWAGYNVDASFLNKYIWGKRLRGLIGLRFLYQNFDDVPLLYTNVYNSGYANISGLLGTISIFTQDFYKVQYIYGFGRNEDIPEGLNFGITSGFTRKNNLNRPYLGFKFERSYFTEKKRYLDFTARVEGSLSKRQFQDVTSFLNVDFFNRLKNLGQWKQRTFLSAGFAWQINSVLNDPLYLESKFGLPEFRSRYMRGFVRATIKGESVFYSPFSIAFFRFAPFVFYNTSLFTPSKTRFENSDLYTSIGGGIRTRNESLIFGTLELRAFYFPGKNADKEKFRIQFSSNLKYKYNTTLAAKPDFIQFN